MNIQGLTAPTFGAPPAPVLFSDPITAERDSPWLRCLTQSYAEGVTRGGMSCKALMGSRFGVLHGSGLTAPAGGVRVAPEMMRGLARARTRTRLNFSFC